MVMHPCLKINKHLAAAVRLIADKAVATVQSAAAGPGSAAASAASQGQQKIADRASMMLLESAKLQHAEVCLQDRFFSHKPTVVTPEVVASNTRRQPA
jgi:hypothetical protein